MDWVRVELEDKVVDVQWKLMFVSQKYIRLNIYIAIVIVPFEAGFECEFF